MLQGSESLASWKANLLFEPIQFEVNAIMLAVLSHFCELLLYLVFLLLKNCIQLFSSFLSVIISVILIPTAEKRLNN